MKKCKITIESVDLKLFKKYPLFKLTSNNESLQFVMKYKDYVKLDDLIKQKIINFELENKLLSFVKVNILYLITLLILPLILYFQSVSYREIIVDDTQLSEEIQTKIKDVSITLGRYNYLKISIKDLEKQLELTYPNLEFIGIEKRSSKIFVEVKKTDDYYNDFNDQNAGDLVARKNGYIVGMKIEKGIPIVELNQVVSKNEVLVSGNILMNKDGVKYIHPRGEVFAETLEYLTIDVNKEYYRCDETGNIEEKFKLVFFNKNFRNKSNYLVYRTEYQVLFKISNLLTLYKIKNIELEEEHYFLDMEKASLEGIKIIENQFNQNKGDSDRILNIERISVIENDDYFQITYLVRAYENIAVFKSIVNPTCIIN